MTERLYHADAGRTTFEARVIERPDTFGRPAVILDKTAFYPTSGGQPHDRGRLNEVEVVDVTVRPGDGAVVHLLAAPLTAVNVQGRIDWPRRFDHMQQHTGQHILSQAFIRTASSHTVGFHLTAGRVTIDLDQPELTAVQVEQAERLANEIVWQNRPVTARIVSQEEAARLALRKVPDVDGDTLRLVDIADFDLTACGGTHVAATGAVGLIKLTKLERRAGALRVEFRCGGRALADYNQKNDILNRLAAELTTGYWEVEKIVAAMREELKQNGRLLKQQKAQLLSYTAERYLKEAEQIGETLVVSRAFEESEGADTRQLAQQLARHPNVVALLGVSGPAVQIVFCRAPDAPGDMNLLLKSALATIESARGGGGATFAQAGGPAVAHEQVEQLLAHAKQQLRIQIGLGAGLVSTADRG